MEKKTSPSLMGTLFFLRRQCGLVLELEPFDRVVSGLSSAAVVLFPGKRVSNFLWTSLLMNYYVLNSI